MVMLAREIFTVFCFVAFLFIVYYAFNRRNQSMHEAVGKSIIEDDDSQVVEVIEQSPRQ